MSETVTTWDGIHGKQRHQLTFPSEDVVRFLAQVRREHPGSRILDIGCGGGRHMRAAHDLGLRPLGVDHALVAVEHTRRHGFPAYQTQMHDLPFDDKTFNAALAFGVFYYGTPADTERAIGEMYRILKPGGLGFVSLKNMLDWRNHRGDDLGNYTTLLRIPGEPEDGLTLNFVSLPTVEEMFSGFSQIRVESLEWTQAERCLLNSDWLIMVTR